MQQLTCNIDLSCSLYYIFFSFVLIELKPLCFERESLGGKILKKCEEVRKMLKNSETILRFSCCPILFSMIEGARPKALCLCAPSATFLQLK